MLKKVSSDKWEAIINKYYESESSKTIKKFCEENVLSPQQFHYHKKRIRERDSGNNKDTLFYKVNINDVIMDTNQNSNFKSNDVNIAIGNISINIPVSEAMLIANIIKELASNVKP